MYKDKSIIGIIPARWGSKGVPYKNIRLLNGKPLVAWTIETALASKYLDKVIVSTDNGLIAETSVKYGAEVPFRRPKKYATDKSRSIDVILHAIKWLEGHNEFYDYFMMLQPTSPLRISEDIDKAIELLFTKNAMAIVSVCETDHHPYWSNMLSSDGGMKDFLERDVMNKTRQELPVYYRLNGAIYLANKDYLKTQCGFIGEKTYAYIMPRERSIDIDCEIDMGHAEFMMKINRGCCR